MPSTSGAIRAGRAFVEAFLDASQLERQLKTVGKNIAKIGASLAGVGTAIAAPLVAATKHFLEAGDALSKMSDRTGLTVEALSQLNYAAGQSGTSSEALETGLKKMSNLLFDASNGSKAANETLSRLGLSVDKLRALEP